MSVPFSHLNFSELEPAIHGSVRFHPNRRDNDAWQRRIPQCTALLGIFFRVGHKAISDAAYSLQVHRMDRVVFKVAA